MLLEMKENFKIWLWKELSENEPQSVVLYVHYSVWFDTLSHTLDIPNLPERGRYMHSYIFITRQ